MGTCGGAVDLSSAQYGDAMTLLSEQGIQLHLMTPLDLQFQGPSNRNRLLSRIYGFSANSVVTASGPNTELRKYLAEPKNLLTTLVQESAGSIYNLNRLEARKRSSVKKASTIISQSIAEENSSPSPYLGKYRPSCKNRCYKQTGFFIGKPVILLLVQVLLLVDHPVHHVRERARQEDD